MDLGDIAGFVRVVEAVSFGKAARLLDMPNTTVSARVARLENRLGSQEAKCVTTISPSG
jgi:DNA-binding transcriptional LysR family regulator